MRERPTTTAPRTTVEARVRRPGAIALAVLLAAGSASPAHAQQARPAGPLVPIEPTLVGYNIGTWRSGPSWRDEDLQKGVRRLAPGHLRYPGGTVANYWDWRTGTTLGYLTSIEPYLEDGLYLYRPETPRLRPADVVAGMPPGTDVVYVVNLARPASAGDDFAVGPDDEIANPDDERYARRKARDAVDALRAFADAGHRVPHVELGNEFYQGAPGGKTDQGGIYTGEIERYVRHAAIVSRAIRAHDASIEIGVIGEAAPTADANGTRWTAAIHCALTTAPSCADPRLAGLELVRLPDVDGVTYHWYSGPGDLTGLSGSDAAEKSLAQAQRHARSLVANDLRRLPAGVDAWSSEYNTFSSPATDAKTGLPLDKSGIAGGPIQGTWTNGLFVALQTMRYAALDPRVEMLTVHNIAFGANEQWNTLYAPDTPSGNGVAMGAVARAFRGRTELRELVFDDLPVTTTIHDTPAVYGVRLSGGGGEALAIVNATREPVPGLALAPSLLRDRGHAVEQHHDATPMSRAGDGDAVRAGRGGGLSSNWFDLAGDRVDLPPFSLTVVRSTDR